MARLRESELLDVLAVLKNEMTNSKSAAKIMQKHLDASFKDSVFDDGDQLDRSMSNSITSADRLSITSETDFNAMVADMTVRIPNLDGPLLDAGFVEQEEEEEEDGTETEEKAQPQKFLTQNRGELTNGEKSTGEAATNDSGIADENLLAENNNRLTKTGVDSKTKGLSNGAPGPEFVNGV